jgi:hypothetical protein
MCSQVWLASQRPGIAGVVLHSPMLSGVRVFNPNLKYWCAHNCMPAALLSTDFA